MEKKTNTLTLNAEGVMRPLIHQLWQCQNIILFGLRSVDTITDFPSSTDEENEVFMVHIGEAPKDLDVQKELYRKWLIKKGFEDLSKGIKLALIEAYYYVSVVNKKDQLKTYEDFRVEIEDLQKKAIELPLPGLLSKVTPYLKNKLRYEDHISSINRARNCLVHAGGVITDRHINNKENSRLDVKGIRWKMFYEKDGEQVEVKAGVKVDGGTTVMMGQEEFSLNFEKGEQVEVSLEHFNNFIKTCWLFGVDLKDNLPEIKPPNEQ